jgi:CRISPR-associated protein Csh2
MLTTPELALPKSELLFLYESTYSVPNGDPFTGEQRFDEETKRVLVSDVRIKRFVRDFLFDNGQEIYVRNDRSNVKAKAEGETAESGAAARFNTLEAADPKLSAEDLLTQLIDVRLFGGISTKTGKAVNLTGPVQFALLNPSLNAVDLRMHQNTSVFASKTDNTRGAIGTTTVVPYALCQIHGWINPYSARLTKLSQNDVQTMFSALWHGINNANTRTKSNQSSLLLLQIVYSEPTRKAYGLDNAIKLEPGARDGNPLREEQIRSREDYSLNFDKLNEIAASPAVQEVRFYTESDDLRQQLGGNKFRAMETI